MEAEKRLRFNTNVIYVIITVYYYIRNVIYVNFIYYVSSNYIDYLVND